MADRAFLEHGDAADAVVLREEVSRRESVAAASHDDGVVAGLQLRRHGIARGQRSLRR